MSDYGDPTARARRLDDLGLDEEVPFPNYRLLWERRLSEFAGDADGEHGDVEPLGRDGGGQRAAAACTRWCT